VQDAIRNVRIVYNWGERNELIAVNKWHLFVYKVAKEKRTKPRAEYRSDEFLAIWKALNPEWRGQWRAWVAVGLLGIYGNRQNEILNLRWSWIEGDAVRIDPSVVKTGEESVADLCSR
jgi:integrase